MVFANWALVIATMVLALITFFYMRQTKKQANQTERMADIMVKEFDLRIAPFIVIDQLSITQGTTVREYHPVISNKGFFPVHIIKIILEGWLKESPLENFRKEIKIDKTLGRNDSTKYGDIVIQLRKSELTINTSEKGKDYNFNQLLDSSEGIIYFTCVGRDGKEQKTSGRYYEHL